jgi:hypothetical protein
VTDSSKLEDFDMAAVADLLEAATRAPADPDVELAHLLHRLEGANDAELRKILEKLVRDAHHD